MKRCHCCQERFGLIRHHYDRRQFCSAICVASYRAMLHQAAKHAATAGTEPARPPMGPPTPTPQSANV
jgi:hypothetical protein